MRGLVLSGVMLLAACGGKVEQVPLASDPEIANPNPDPVPTTIVPTPTPLPPRPTPAPAPTPSPTSTSTSTKPTPAPTPKDPLGEKLPPTEGVACAAGTRAEMSFHISATNMNSGAGASGAGYCVGTIEFQDDLAATFPVGYPDYGTPVPPHGWPAMVTSQANGYSVLVGARMDGRVHTADLHYADGKIERQYCSFYALCENGVARAVSFTW